MWVFTEFCCNSVTLLSSILFLYASCKSAGLPTKFLFVKYRKQFKDSSKFLITFQQNWLKQGVEQFALKSINLLILFGIRRNCLMSGRSRSLDLFLRRVIKHCSNYTGISLLPNVYKILSNILLPRLTPYAEEIIGDHQGRYRHNRSTIAYILHSSITREKIGIQWNSA
jgi:hypothetical protein